MNNRIKAIQSHFEAQRERVIADLDSVLNGSTAWDFDKAVNLIRELAIANQSLNTVDMIVRDNSPQQASGITLEQLTELDRLAQAIRDKVSPDQNEENNEQDNAS